MLDSFKRLFKNPEEYDFTDSQLVLSILYQSKDKEVESMTKLHSILLLTQKELGIEYYDDFKGNGTSFHSERLNNHLADLEALDYISITEKDDSIVGGSDTLVIKLTDKGIGYVKLYILDEFEPNFPFDFESIGDVTSECDDELSVNIIREITKRDPELGKEVKYI